MLCKIPAFEVFCHSQLFLRDEIRVWIQIFHSMRKRTALVFCKRKTGNTYKTWLPVKLSGCNGSMGQPGILIRCKKEPVSIRGQISKATGDGVSDKFYRRPVPEFRFGKLPVADQAVYCYGCSEVFRQFHHANPVMFHFIGREKHNSLTFSVQKKLLIRRLFSIQYHLNPGPVFHHNRLLFHDPFCRNVLRTGIRQTLQLRFQTGSAKIYFKSTQAPVKI